MKKILQQQADDRRTTPGYHFTNENPEVTLNRSGPFSGSSGKRMMGTKINIDKFNKDVRSWGQKVQSQLKQETISRFNKGKKKNRIYKSGIHKGKNEKKLSRSLKVKFRKERGGEQIETVAFGLERHGVFLQKGVGSGYVSSGGGVARIAKSDDGKYRFADNWFNGTLDKNIDSLSDTIVKHAGNGIVLNTKRMYIQ